MFNHILFATDLSESENAKASQHAFKYAMEIAIPFKAKITLFHAYELLSSSVAGIYDLSYTTALQEIETSMEERAKLHLGTLKQQLDEARVDNDLLIARGHAGQLIVNAAESNQCDLIIMGNRGLGPVSAMLMGSTSTYVLHHSHIPMLIVPMTANEESEK